MKGKTGRYVILICVACLIVVVSITRYADYDFWWHLKLGEHAFHSGQIYTTDSFSYTFDGKAQYSAEWLGDIILYFSHRMGGMVGATLLKASVLLLTFLFLFLTLKNISREEVAGFYAAIITLVLVLFSIRFRLFIRPYLFSFLFFSLFLYLFSRYERTGNVKVLYLLPCIEAIWANMSTGAIFGPFLFLWFAIGNRGNPRRNRMLLILLAAVTGASLFNPELYRIYSLPLTLLVHNPYKATIGEHQSLTPQLLWGYGLKYTFAYQVLVLGSLLYFVFFKGWRNFSHVMLFAAFFTASVMQVRMIDFFSFISAVFFIVPVQRLFNLLLVRPPSRKLVMDITASMVILALIALSMSSKTYSFGMGIKDDTFPEEAIAFLEREGIEGRMFNSYPFGGYIAWRSPGRKIFIDGRSTRLYTPEFFNAYFEMLKNPDVWKSAEQKWGFDYAVLEYDMMSKRFPGHLPDNDDWALVYWDSHSAVYLKRIEKYLKTIEMYEYTVTRPRYYDFSYLQSYLYSGKALEAVRTIDREIAMNPSHQEPRLAKVFLLYFSGRAYYDEALKELETSLRLKPELAAEHSALAFIMLGKGFPDKAQVEVERALSLDPNDPGAVYLKQKLEMKSRTQKQ